MNRIHILISFFFALSISVYSQKTVSTYTGLPSLVWPKLYDIKFEKAKDKLGEYEKPIFSQAAKTLNGKVVILPGYMVPFEGGTK